MTPTFTPVAHAPGSPAPLALGSRLSALGALFVLTLRQYLRGRRTLVLAFLYLLPVGLGLFLRRHEEQREPFEFVLILNMIPHAMVPLAALLYASAMIQDEIEEQTLTYLLIRPISKWALYVTKLAATFLTTILLTALFTTITYVVIYWGSPDLWGAIPLRSVKVAALMALSLAAYGSLFGGLSLFTRRSLVVSVAYIIIFEGLLANVDFAIRRLTVIYYFRILAARWLELPSRQIDETWSLHLDTDPGAGQCVLVLLIASLVASVCAAAVFASREFRLKTPEGN